MPKSPRKLGEFFRDVIKLNPDNFRLFCPDETNSNRLNAVFDATDRCSMAANRFPSTITSAPTAACSKCSANIAAKAGWRAICSPAGTACGPPTKVSRRWSIRCSRSTAKWLEQCEELPWRRPIASLNIFLTSHCWRNDHNGFSHQAPGFVDNALARRSTVIRIYYPPDANTLLSTIDHCLRTRNYVNLVTCGKQEQLQWLNMQEAIEHCSRGASRWAIRQQRQTAWRARCDSRLRRRRSHAGDRGRFLAAAEVRSGDQSPRSSISLISPCS